MSPLKTAHMQLMADVDPSSVITNVPSAAVGVKGFVSEFTKNNLPFDNAQATLLSSGK